MSSLSFNCNLSIYGIEEVKRVFCVEMGDESTDALLVDLFQRLSETVSPSLAHGYFYVVCQRSADDVLQ